LIVWDVGNLLFGKSSFRLPAIPDQHLLIGRLANDEAIGVPIDAPPTTQAVLSSAIQPTTDLPGIIAIMTAGHQYYVLDLAAIENL
jgi:lipoprotein-anchoring transpeptidase ErfK/SrfK